MYNNDHIISQQDAHACETDCNSIEDVVDGLQTVIGDINRFLQQFCDRLQQLATSGTCSTDPADKGEDWEMKRESAEQRIRQQVDLLADAWLRLEEEQRCLLQKQGGLAEDVAQRAQSSTAVINGGPGSQCVPGGSHPPSSPARIQQSAIDEFERMRHEIQSSRTVNGVQRD